MASSISFVIPTFRRPDALRATLQSVLAIEYPPDLCEIIVVDNAGDGATQDVMRSYVGSMMSVCHVVETRGGSARARNHGARLADGDVLILLDDDILVEPSHIRRHLDTRELYGDCLAGGNWRYHPSVLAALEQTSFGRYRIALDHRFRDTRDGRQLDQHRWQVEAIAACNLMISRRLFWELGGFDEEFPFAGVEDREFSMRAIAAGCQLIRDDMVGLLHNDQTITLEQFCVREEHSAQTIAVLTRKHPDAEPSRSFIAVNGPIALGDSPAVLGKKLAKRLLVTPPLIRFLPAAAHLAERVGLGEQAMEGVYSGIVGVHIFRGFRRALPVSRR